MKISFSHNDEDGGGPGLKAYGKNTGFRTACVKCGVQIPADNHQYYHVDKARPGLDSDIFFHQPNI